MLNEITIIIITLVASAFFSGMEIAFVSSDKLRLELDKTRNRLNTRLINTFNRHPGQYIATMLVGNNIALVVYSLSFAKLVEILLAGYIPGNSLMLLIQTLVSTIIILIVAEFLPKALFRINPILALHWLSLPVDVAGWAMRRWRHGPARRRDVRYSVRRGRSTTSRWSSRPLPTSA